jgi:hypothetical protein
MRQLGLFMGESVKLTHGLYGVSRGEAKLAVHYSQTWADCRESSERLHDAAFAAAKELGFEEVDEEPSAHEASSAFQTAR